MVAVHFDDCGNTPAGSTDWFTVKGLMDIYLIVYSLLQYTYTLNKQF